MNELKLYLIIRNNALELTIVHNSLLIYKVTYKYKIYKICFIETLGWYCNLMIFVGGKFDVKRMITRFVVIFTIFSSEMKSHERFNYRGSNYRDFNGHR